MNRFEGTPRRIHWHATNTPPDQGPHTRICSGLIEVLAARLYLGCRGGHPLPNNCSTGSSRPSLMLRRSKCSGSEWKSCKICRAYLQRNTYSQTEQRKQRSPSATPSPYAHFDHCGCLHCPSLPCLSCLSPLCCMFMRLLPYSCACRCAHFPSSSSTTFCRVAIQCCWCYTS
jgi:hypothetical protein